MNLGAVLVTGLFAGGVSCAAVQGGLLAGLVTRQRGTPTRTTRPGATGKGGKGQRPRPTPTRAAAKTATKTATKAATKTASPQTRPVAGRTRTAPPPPTPWPARLADDLAPVGGFLAGKLVSHTVLGALLGTLGTVVQISLTLRAVLQLGAGALIIAFGLAQLGVRGFRRFAIQPPTAVARFVRGRARSESALAPALLGLATVLIPCGITLSVEALALTSGSAWAGAATMAVFVLGTSPLFAALGYAARMAATAWRGRLAVATGLVVIGLGLYTLNGGLTVLDSPLAAHNLAQTLGLSAPPATAETVSTDSSGQQTAALTATTGSYSPANILLKAGVPTTLVIRSQDAGGCIRAFIIRGKQYILPENGDTPIDLGALPPGEVNFRCGMGMYTGQLTVVP